MYKGIKRIKLSFHYVGKFKLISAYQKYNFLYICSSSLRQLFNSCQKLEIMSAKLTSFRPLDVFRGPSFFPQIVNNPVLS